MMCIFPRAKIIDFVLEQSSAGENVFKGLILSSQHLDDIIGPHQELEERIDNMSVSQVNMKLQAGDG